MLVTSALSESLSVARASCSSCFVQLCTFEVGGTLGWVCNEGDGEDGGKGEFSLGGPAAQLTLAGGVWPAGAGFLAGGDSVPSALPDLFFFWIGPRVGVLGLDVVSVVFFKDAVDSS